MHKERIDFIYIKYVMFTHTKKHIYIYIKRKRERCKYRIAKNTQVAVSVCETSISIPC